jgi:hypothetical protein
VPVNSVRKCHFLFSWSIRPGQAPTPAGGLMETRALRFWPVEPKTLLKTSGTWFESLLPNRNPKQYIPACTRTTFALDRVCCRGTV